MPTDTEQVTLQMLTTRAAAMLTALPSNVQPYAVDSTIVDRLLEAANEEEVQYDGTWDAQRRFLDRIPFDLFSIADSDREELESYRLIPREEDEETPEAYLLQSTAWGVHYLDLLRQLSEQIREWLPSSERYTRPLAIELECEIEILLAKTVSGWKQWAASNEAAVGKPKLWNATDDAAIIAVRLDIQCQLIRTRCALRKFAMS